MCEPATVGAASFRRRLLRRPLASSPSSFALLSGSCEKVRFIWLKGSPFDNGVKPMPIGRRSGVLSADNMGLPPFRIGVDVRDSRASRCKPFGALTAAKEPGVAGGAEGG
jgi:hypothetical protein